MGQETQGATHALSARDATGFHLSSLRPKRLGSASTRVRAPPNDAPGRDDDVAEPVPRLVFGVERPGGGPVVGGVRRKEDDVPLARYKPVVIRHVPPLHVWPEGDGVNPGPVSPPACRERLQRLFPFVSPLPQVRKREQGRVV